MTLIFIIFNILCIEFIHYLFITETGYVGVIDIIYDHVSTHELFTCNQVLNKNTLRHSLHSTFYTIHSIIFCSYKYYFVTSVVFY